MEENVQRLILMKGHPGVGKSSIAKGMAHQLRIPLISKDDARDSLSIPSFNQVDLNALSYDIMWRYAETQLRCGLSVVVDCPLAREELYNVGAGLAAQVGAKVIVVECVATDASTWRSRLEARREQPCSLHKPQTWEELQQLLKRYDNCYSWSHHILEQDNHLVLDITDGRTPRQLADCAVLQLQEL